MKQGECTSRSPNPPTQPRHSERSLRSEKRFCIARTLCDEISLGLGCLISSCLPSRSPPTLSPAPRSKLSSQPRKAAPDFLSRAVVGRVGPRSGGIVASSRRPPNPVIPNGVREVRNLSWLRSAHISASLGVLCASAFSLAFLVRIESLTMFLTF
jgi:hypothetical protein